MLPRETIDSFKTPEGNVLTLVGRGDDFFIELNNAELMSTRRTGSEIALAEIGCKGLDETTKPRVLIGGLGLGFTLRTALACLPANAELVVAELFPRVVEWNRNYLQDIYDGTLSDHRLKIVVSDVWDQINVGRWNSIMLDTDNGPEAFCLQRNNRLYGQAGLERLCGALVPGGTLAIWSSDAMPTFVKRMKAGGFEARCQVVRERGNRGQRYAIFIGHSPKKRSATKASEVRQTRRQR